jgi:AraC family transcriptional regulator
MTVGTLVPPEDLPNWVPGDVLCASDDLGWKNVYLRAYHYLGQDVIVPAMRDFMIVGYRLGATPMQRRFDGQWSHATCAPGAISLLTRAEQSHWFWSETIDVTHVYFSQDLVLDVASEVMERPIAEVTLADVLHLEDPAITFALQAIATEAQAQGLGGPLYVETMARGVIVHLLRKYASIKPGRDLPIGRLNLLQRRRIDEFIDAHIEEAIDLKSLADQANLPPCNFARQFKRATGKAPYAYVIERRLERAQRLLAFTCLPIKEISASCGFADQAHLTRLFLRSRDRTPAAFRKEFGKDVVSQA